MKKFILAVLCAFFSMLKAQEPIHHFPLWTYYQDSITIDGISIGILTTGNAVDIKTNGIKLEIIGIGILLPLAPGPGFSEDGILTEKPRPDISESINGLNLSATGTACKCLVNGLTAGGMMQMLSHVNGLSVSFFANSSEIHNGVQLSFVANESSYGKGVQVAISNHSTRKRGLQVGVINTSKDLRGIQIGIWNKNGKRALPLVNWQFKAA